MICEEKILTQLPLENLADWLVANPSPPLKSNPVAETQRTLAAEKQRLYAREYRKTHKEVVRETRKRYYEKTKSRRQAEWRSDEYHQKIKDRKAKWPKWKYRQFLKRQAQRQRKWMADHPDKIVEKRKATIDYHRNRLKEDPLFALAHRFRGNIYASLRRVGVIKVHRTHELLGCTIAEAKAHIGSQFRDGMSWDNLKSFHLDHIIPLDAFDLSNAEEVKWAFNWRNFQPLAPMENMRKHATIPDPLPVWLPAHIAQRITLRSQQPAHLPVAPSEACPVCRR